MAEAYLALEDRAALYRALGDERRLMIVDALHHTDRPVGELTGLATNLLAFHLKVLEDAGVIVRSISHGDARRRYVTLNPALASWLGERPQLDRPVERALFVCTANPARSPLAAHLWQARTGAPARSAGTRPADRVHPRAVEIARRRGLDLTAARPVAYHEVELRPELVVSVCDRAHEDELALVVPRLHWSIPDPVGFDDDAFEAVVGQLSTRIDRLARAASQGAAA